MALSVGTLGRNLWQGLAADTKPTKADTRVAVNDCFFETDTKLWYLWNGEAWTCTTHGNSPAIVDGSGGTPPPMI
jgi:hypothetical protein